MNRFSRYYRPNRHWNNWDIFKFIVKIAVVMVVFFAGDYYLHNSDASGNTIIMTAITKIVNGINSFI